MKIAKWNREIVELEANIESYAKELVSLDDILTGYCRYASTVILSHRDLEELSEKIKVVKEDIASTKRKIESSKKSIIRREENIHIENKIISNKR